MDLQLEMRQAARRQPVILNRTGLMGLIAKLEGHYKTPALLQYGAGRASGNQGVRIVGQRPGSFWLGLKRM